MPFFITTELFFIDINPSIVFILNVFASGFVTVPLLFKENNTPGCWPSCIKVWNCRSVNGISSGIIKVGFSVCNHGPNKI